MANRAGTCPYGCGDSKCELVRGEQGMLGYCRVSAESKLKPMLLCVLMLVCVGLIGLSPILK